MTAKAEPQPWVEIPHLDQLWFQVAGTLCNLTCQHCFISCSPKNDAFGFLTLAEVQRRLAESASLGVKEYYFTGGEPFLNPEMTAILVETLRYGPASVLTNGTVLKDEWLAELREAEQAGPYSLEFRVSIDGFSPETNDPIRGAGTFARALRGVGKLVEHGFLPIITAARVWPLEDDEAVIGQFLNTLRNAGYSRPRLKILPTLQLGAEEHRTHGYLPEERVTSEMLEGYDRSQLVCHHGRMVTDRGVHVCPILIEAADSLLDQSLAGALRPFAIGHGACTTCYQHGAICSNASSRLPERNEGSNGIEQIDHPSPQFSPSVRGSQSFANTRIALLGGIYSNYLALEAALLDIRRRGVEAIYCLGDLGAFGPHPDRVFPLLDGHDVACVRGNYDDSVGRGLADCQCGYTDPRDNHFARLSYDYTLANTSPQNREWLQTLPGEIRLEFGDLRVLLCHGSPRQMNEFLWESTTSSQFLDHLAREHEADVICTTHTGIKWRRELTRGRQLVNVGVLGRPENDGRTNVWYTLLEHSPSGGLIVEFVPVEYDHLRLAAEMRAEHLPEEFVETVLTGWWTTCLEVLPARERRHGRF